MHVVELPVDMDDERLRGLSAAPELENGGGGQPSSFVYDPYIDEETGDSEGYVSENEDDDDDDRCSQHDDVSGADDESLSVDSRPPSRSTSPSSSNDAHTSAVDSTSFTLPASSEDLLLPNHLVLTSLEVYEVCRRFGSVVQLSPFLFEQFCAALAAQEQSPLLDHIHIAFIRLLVKDDEASDTLYGPQDTNCSMNLMFYLLDHYTYGEVLRRYVESDDRFPPAVLEACESSNYPFVTVEKRLTVLHWLSSRILESQIIRDELVSDGKIKYDDHCRECGKYGDLLCCDTCPAVYHLYCIGAASDQVPPNSWKCSICARHELHGVTDCAFEWEKNGQLQQQQPLGYDRCGRRYWFIARRIIVEDDQLPAVYYYSTLAQFYQLLLTFNGLGVEKDLCLSLLQLSEHIVYQLKINEELTAQMKSTGDQQSWIDADAERRFAWLDTREPPLLNGSYPPALFDLLKVISKAWHEQQQTKKCSVDKKDNEQQKSAKNGSSAKAEEAPKLEQHEPSAEEKSVCSKLKDFYFDPGPLFKIGMERSYMNYKNLYQVDPLGKSPYQRAEEHRKAKYLADRFQIEDDPDFKWPADPVRSEETTLNILKQEAITMQGRMPAAVLHPSWWKDAKSSWRVSSEAVSNAAQLIFQMCRFEAFVRTVCFTDTWRNTLGQTKLCRQTAEDREERNNRLKQKAKEQHMLNDENPNVIWVKYTLLGAPPKHQIWKQKDEQYRVNGEGALGGWIWIKSGRRVMPHLSTKPKREFVWYLKNGSEVDDLLKQLQLGLIIDGSVPVSSVGTLPSQKKALCSNLLRVYNKASDRDEIDVPAAIAQLGLKRHVRGLNVSAALTDHSLYYKTSVAPARLDRLLDIRQKQNNGTMAAKSFHYRIKRFAPTGQCYSFCCRSGFSCGCYSPSCQLVGGEIDTAVYKHTAEKHVLELSQRRTAPATLARSKFAPPPVIQRFRYSRSDKHNILILPSHVIWKLARRGGLQEDIEGFSHTAKASPWSWTYPCARPTMQTCWRYATQKLRTMHAAAFLYRLLNINIRWNDVLQDMPLQTRHILKSDSYNESREILQHKNLPPFGLSCTYLIRMSRMPPSDSRYGNMFLSSSEVEDYSDMVEEETVVNPQTPSTPWCLRERKKKERKSVQSPASRVYWVDESLLNIWEIKNYWAVQERLFMLEKSREVAVAKRAVSNNGMLHKVKVDGKIVTPIAARVAGSISLTNVAGPVRIASDRFIIDRQTGVVQGLRALGKNATIRPGAVQLISAAPLKIVKSGSGTGSPILKQTAAGDGPKPVFLIRLSNGRTVISSSSVFSKVIGNRPAKDTACLKRADHGLEPEESSVVSDAKPSLFGSQFSSPVTGSKLLSRPKLADVGETEPKVAPRKAVPSRTTELKSHTEKNREILLECAELLRSLVDRTVDREKFDHRQEKRRLNSKNRRFYWKEYRLKRKALKRQEECFQNRYDLWRKELLKRRQLLEHQMLEEVEHFLATKGIRENLIRQRQLYHAASRADVPSTSNVRSLREPRTESRFSRRSTSTPDNALSGVYRGYSPGREETPAKKPRRDRTRSSATPTSAASVKTPVDEVVSLRSQPDEAASSSDTPVKRARTSKDFRCSLCKLPYSPEKFYIACELCSRWFHGSCVNVSEQKSRHLASWSCADCLRERRKVEEELYCICRTPYDENRAYVCCDACDGWFHCECVGLTTEMAEAIPSYICDSCSEKKGGAAVATALKLLDDRDYAHLLTLVSELKRHPLSWPFQQPIDSALHPNFSTIVPDATDISAVETKVMNQAYTHLSDFTSEMAKIFNGARKYFAPGCAEFQCATVLDRYLTEKLHEFKKTCGYEL